VQFFEKQIHLLIAENLLTNSSQMMSEVLNWGELEREAGADNGTSQRDAKRVQTHVRPSAMGFFNESR
jgi:hypothetical protein